ncbi:zinc-binding dehydrogenase [Roseixanthobacter pseudopolyaromaticivorans]|uniref:zinc-binding dehydrogenase n=1 Tax=Xanthobacteraceae TaxID=335928 RepID=UPI003729F8C4
MTGTAPNLAELPEFSRAAVVRRFGEPVKIECVPVPRAPEPGALIVRTTACSICGTDVHLSRGNLSLTVDLPIILGHEMVGRVVAIGAGAERDSVGQKLAIGDRILWTHTACGQCFFCTVARQPTLCENRRAYMYENIEKPPYLLGGFSEYGYVLPQSGRVRVPDNLDDAVASLCSCAFRSVMNAFDNLGPIDPSEHVAIQGAGPLGILAAAVARVAGARTVSVIGAPAPRLALAQEFGATHVFTIEGTTHADRAAELRALTDGRGPDIVMEFTGHPDAFGEGLDLVRKGGRYLTVGQLGGGTTTFSPSTIVKKNIRVIGSFSGDVKSYWKALQFASAHIDTIPFGKMITGRFALADVNTALERMHRLEEIKPLIVMT